MEKVIKEVFKAVDGKVFETELECTAHEKDLTQRAKRLNSLSFFSVTHGPDLTEGRGYSGSLLVVIEEPQYGPAPENFLIDFCLTHFGNKVQYVMGVSPMTGWNYKKVEHEVLDDLGNLYARCGDYKYKGNVVFLSNSEESIAGLPKATVLKFACEDKKYPLNYLFKKD